jgi:hypothetical protein
MQKAENVNHKWFTELHLQDFCALPQACRQPEWVDSVILTYLSPRMRSPVKGL